MTVRGPLIVTGTDTGVGKTVVTAAVAACATAQGLKVAVLKPAQTGTAAGEESDVDVVRRLAAPATARALAEFAEPLAPLAAARVARREPLRIDTVAAEVRIEMITHDLVLIEGAGGLLVPMGSDSWTLADLARLLGASAIVVARPGLGTLNHTALTMEALQRRGVPASVVIGAWPVRPELVHVSNFVDLATDLAGAVPEGASAIEPGVFRRSAPGWFTPALYGAVDDVREWIDEVN